MFQHHLKAQANIYPPGLVFCHDLGLFIIINTLQSSLAIFIALINTTRYPPLQNCHHQSNAQYAEY